MILIYQRLWSVTLFTISICCSRKKGFGHLFTFIIRTLSYTYVPSRLVHFAHSASIAWNRKTQRSLVRGRGTSIVWGWNQFIYINIFLNFLTPPKEPWESYSNLTVRPFARPSIPLHVRCTSPIFIEVGPHLMCGCILGWVSVAYHFRVTVTLISDLVFRLFVSGAYLLYYLR